MRRPQETPAPAVGPTDSEERLHRAAEAIGVDLRHLQEAYRTAGMWAVRLEEEARRAEEAARESDRPDEIARVARELAHAAELARAHELSVEALARQMRTAALVVASEMPT
jgi:hypothetical protein